MAGARNPRIGRQRITISRFTGKKHANYFDRYRESAIVLSMRCPVCGVRLEPYGGSGRPRIYCSDTCRWAQYNRLHRTRPPLGYALLGELANRSLLRMLRERDDFLVH